MLLLFVVGTIIYKLIVFFLCSYNPKRWAGVDEDDSDMEVGFDVIQKEEWRRYIYFVYKFCLSFIFIAINWLEDHIGNN